MKSILTEASKHSVVDCLKELKFGRPVAGQDLLDKLIKIAEEEQE